MSYTLPMVVKTGPDRPVEPIEPGTGLNSSPVRHENRSISEPETKPENRCKTGQNRKTGGSSGSTSRTAFCHFIRGKRSETLKCNIEEEIEDMRVSYTAL